jgi:ribosome biogenesis protein ENP2
MHGYFMDIRLYRKAKLVNEPFNFDEFKRTKIKESIEKERENRVKITRQLPKVNTELAKRLIEDGADVTAKKKTKEASAGLLQDTRFNQLFTNPNFQIDPNSDEFKLLNPVVQKVSLFCLLIHRLKFVSNLKILNLSQVNEKKLKKTTKTVEVKDSRPVKNFNGSDSDRGGSSESDDDEDDSGDGSESSSDDEHQWKQTVKDSYKQLQKDKKVARKQRPFSDSNTDQNSADIKQPKFYEIKEGLEYYNSASGSGKAAAKLNNDILKREQMKKLPMQSRLKFSGGNDNNGKDSVIVHNDSYGNKQMTFLSRRAQRDKEGEERAREHHEERKTLRRSAGKIVKTFKKPAMPGGGSSKFFRKK